MKIPQIATRSAGSTKMFLHKNGPTLLTTAGVVGFIASTALTIRATVKATDLFPEIAADVREAKATVVGDDVTDKQKVEALVRVYAQHTGALAKMYAPAALVGSASILCVLAGHGMMKNRQAALVAAYAALDSGYKSYRSRVQQALGEDKERELYRGGPVSVSMDDEGKPCEIQPIGDNPSPYGRFFDQCSPNWTKTPEYNLLFLRSQQDWANDRLRAHGFLFLNEVYEGLGLERSQAGQIVGWKLKGNGDGYVDFGLYAIGDDNNRAFVNNIEPVVFIDFNVDGPISI